MVRIRKCFKSEEFARIPIIIGITRGNIMLIVPHEVPVEKDMMAERIKTTAGKSL
jgi:hypothetical protein